MRQKCQTRLSLEASNVKESICAGCNRTAPQGAELLSPTPMSPTWAGVTARKRQKYKYSVLPFLAGPAWLEHATLCFEGRCSIHLSYGPGKNLMIARDRNVIARDPNNV